MELLIYKDVDTEEVLYLRFKFQYGATNMSKFQLKWLLYCIFKFQYGATNIYIEQLETALEFEI